MRLITLFGKPQNKLKIRVNAMTGAAALPAARPCARRSRSRGANAPRFGRSRGPGGSAGGARGNADTAPEPPRVPRALGGGRRLTPTNSAAKPAPARAGAAGGGPVFSGGPKPGGGQGPAGAHRAAGVDPRLSALQPPPLCGAGTAAAPFPAGQSRTAPRRGRVSPPRAAPPRSRGPPRRLPPPPPQHPPPPRASRSTHLLGHGVDESDVEILLRPDP